VRLARERPVSARRMKRRKGWYIEIMNDPKSSRMLKRVAMAGVLVLAAVPLFAQDGDAAKGKELVAANQCTRCHRIGDTGSRVGPNLTDIGDRRTPERLETSILQPDAEVLPENRFVLVTMKDGTTVRGRLLNHDAISVQLLDGKEQLRSIELKDAKG
jgi:putative heme-binding domain-containing protein